MVPARRSDDLDHLNVPGEDQNASEDRYGSGMATPSSKSLVPSPQPVDHKLRFSGYGFLNGVIARHRQNEQKEGVSLDGDIFGNSFRVVLM